MKSAMCVHSSWRAPQLGVCFSLLLGLIAGAAQAQSELESRLSAELAQLDGARMHLTLDKPLYRPGETIWFRAWELRPSAGLEQQAHELRFELLDPRGSSLLEKKVWAEQGVATNDFELPLTLAGGEYTLRVYSSLGATGERPLIISVYEPPRVKKTLEFVRKSYAAGEEVSATVKLERGTGEALASVNFEYTVTLDGSSFLRDSMLTNAKGEALLRFTLPSNVGRGDGLLTVLINDAGVVESIQKRIPITPDQLLLQLFPEGGELVQGLPSRVYYSAKTPLGKEAEITLRVVDDAGTVLSESKTFYGGMGRFELTPKADRRYWVEVVEPAPREGQSAQRVALPDAAQQGCVLQSKDASQDDELHLWLACSEQQEVYVAATLRAQLLETDSAEVGPEGEALELSLPADSVGAVRVTLFDDAYRPIAERLVYRGLSGGTTLELTTDKKSYSPRGTVELTLTAKDADGRPVQGDFAIAVVDDTILSYADDKTPHILASLLLLPEMPGQSIEDPNFYFSDDERAPRAMDLLLGTAGWRRFTQVPR
ncbi:MAG: MG2 domain-containing protein [Myxococcota bacterium]|jgi:hypothetical protein|nr:MG2 domain-containing protein [Myxococcota bacterium]